MQRECVGFELAEGTGEMEGQLVSNCGEWAGSTIKTDNTIDELVCTLS